MLLPNNSVPQKYYYNKATQIYKDGVSYYCFAHLWDKKSTTEYELPLVMNAENADKWLNIINKAIPFKWEMGEKFVKIFPPENGKAFLIFFGNLTKGVSEQAWYCEAHLEDDSDDPFFVKNWRAFVKQKAIRLEVGYCSAHGWFTYADGTVEEYPRTSKTIEEAFKKLDRKGYSVWPNVL